MKKHNRLSIWLLCLCLMSSCVEDQEGCLDPEASNFDPSADISVGCDYPNLILNFQYNFGDTIYNEKSIYYRPVFNDSIRILDFGFVLGNFQMCQTNNCLKLETISDVYSGDDVDSTLVSIDDDLIYVRPDRFNFTSGETRPESNYDQFVFTLGIPNDWRSTRPWSLPSGHFMQELALDDHWSEVDGYHPLFIEVEFGFPINKSRIIIADDLITRSDSISANFGKRVGEDITLNLSLDLSVLCGTIDYELWSDEMIIEELLKNLGSAVQER